MNPFLKKIQNSVLTKMPNKAQLGAKSKFERDEKIANYFIKTFNYITLVGGSYGFFHTRKWSVLSVSLYVVMYSVSVGGTLSLLYASYLVSDHKAVFAQCFHVFLIGLVVLTASITLNLGRELLKEWMEFMLDPYVLSEYSTTGYLDMLENNSRRKKNYLIVVWLFLYGLCALVGVCNPLINSYGEELEMPEVSGVYWKNLPLIFWWPLDAHNTTIGRITLLIYQVIFAFYCAVMCVSAIIACFHSFDKLMNQLELLTHSIENLDQRATVLFKKRYPGMSLKRMKMEYDECYHECVVQNVKHYQGITEKLELFMKLANAPIAVPFFGGAMLLGLAGVNLLADDDPRLGPKLFLCCTGLSEAFNMLLLCHYGECIQELTTNVFNALFYTRWYRRSLKCRRSIIILRYATVKPLKITAAKLIVLNMEAFANLVNSAYSIFNLSSVTSSE